MRASLIIACVVSIRDIWNMNVQSRERMRVSKNEGIGIIEKFKGEHEQRDNINSQVQDNINTEAAPKSH